MTLSEFFPEPIGEFGDNSRHAVRIARELCAAAELLGVQMQTAKLEGEDFQYGGQTGKQSLALLRADLDDLCRPYKLLDQLLNGDGQAEHLAKLHKVGSVQWHGETYGSYSAAMLTMAHAIYNRLNPDRLSPLNPNELVLSRWDKATRLVAAYSKGIDILRVGLEQEQAAIERLIHTQLGRPPKPSSADLVNTAMGKRRNERQQLRDLERAVKNGIQAGLKSVKDAEPPAPGFVFTPIQKAIWDALDGRAMTVEQLALRVSNGDTKRLYANGGLKEMKAANLIVLKRCVGYYRPDSPPVNLIPNTDKK